MTTKKLKKYNISDEDIEETGQISEKDIKEALEQSKKKKKAPKRKTTVNPKIEEKKATKYTKKDLEIIMKNTAVNIKKLCKDFDIKCKSGNKKTVAESLLSQSGSQKKEILKRAKEYVSAKKPAKKSKAKSPPKKKSIKKTSAKVKAAKKPAKITVKKEGYNSYTISQLKKLMNNRNISFSGFKLKKQYVDALEKADKKSPEIKDIEKSVSDFIEEIMSESPEEITIKKPKKKISSEGESILSNISVVELKKLCKKHDIKGCVKKSEIIEKLLKSENADEILDEADKLPKMKSASKKASKKSPEEILIPRKKAEKESLKKLEKELKSLELKLEEERKQQEEMAEKEEVRRELEKKLKELEEESLEEAEKIDTFEFIRNLTLYQLYKMCEIYDIDCKKTSSIENLRKNLFNKMSDQDRIEISEGKIKAPEDDKDFTFFQDFSLERLQKICQDNNIDCKNLNNRKDIIEELLQELTASDLKKIKKESKINKKDPRYIKLIKLTKDKLVSYCDNYGLNCDTSKSKEHLVAVIMQELSNSMIRQILEGKEEEESEEEKVKKIPAKKSAKKASQASKFYTPFKRVGGEKNIKGLFDENVDVEENIDIKMNIPSSTYEKATQKDITKILGAEESKPKKSKLQMEESQKIREKTKEYGVLVKNIKNIGEKPKIAEKEYDKKLEKEFQEYRKKIEDIEKPLVLEKPKKQESKISDEAIKKLENLKQSFVDCLGDFA